MEWKDIKGTVLNNVSMKRYTSMKVGGPVKYMVYPRDEADVITTARVFREEGIGCRFLGNGTNIIVHDKGLDEAMIRPTRIQHIAYRKTEGGAFVDAAAGIPLKSLIRDNARRGLSGLEKLFWIPGTVGGAVKMNAGSFGSWISDHLETVRLADGTGTPLSVSREDMGFGYRTSRVHPSECVLSACFLLHHRNKEEIDRDMEYVYSERKKRHPMDFPSAGSVFKGVDGEPAWKFIERAGLKGLRIGGAMISEKHANFIINTGSATAMNIKLLIDTVKNRVFESTGTLLEEEVELWGFNG